MKSLFTRSLLFLVTLGFFSCVENSKPAYEYMPNMYRTVTYETYGEYDIFENGQEALTPAEGSVSRGWRPYDYEDTRDGYAAAKAELTNPLPYTEKNLAKGRQLYTIYCAVCHGDQGDGQGILVQREKILGIPPYDDPGRAITEGSVYHVMYYGLNAMGSYASQTSIEERWMIDHYVMKLKNDLEGGQEIEYEEEAGSQSNQQMETLTPPVNAREDQSPNEVTRENGGQENQNEE